MTLKNKTPRTNWMPGDACFYYEKWSDRIVSGKIKSISSDKRLVADVTGIDGPDAMARPLDELFSTHADAMGALMDANDAKQAKYEEAMPDVAALVRFAYHHPVAACEEYTDWEARAAYRERAKALLGVDLPN